MNNTSSNQPSGEGRASRLPNFMMIVKSSGELRCKRNTWIKVEIAAHHVIEILPLIIKRKLHSSYRR